MARELDDAIRHRNYAEELRLIAADRATRENRETLLKAADNYDRITNSLEAIHRSKQAQGLPLDGTAALISGLGAPIGSMTAPASARLQQSMSTTSSFDARERTRAESLDMTGGMILTEYDLVRKADAFILAANEMCSASRKATERSREALIRSHHISDAGKLKANTAKLSR